jgi:hypothetical protein
VACLEFCTARYGVGVRAICSASSLGGGSELNSDRTGRGYIENLTGGVPSHVAGYIDITLCWDVWFLLLTLGGGLVCFVTVCGVYVYAGGWMTGLWGFWFVFWWVTCRCKGFPPTI